MTASSPPAAAGVPVGAAEARDRDRTHEPHRALGRDLVQDGGGLPGVEALQHGGRDGIVERRDLPGRSVGAHLGVDADQRGFGLLLGLIVHRQHGLDLFLLGFEGRDALGDAVLEVVQLARLQRETGVGRRGSDVLAEALCVGGRHRSGGRQRARRAPPLAPSGRGWPAWRGDPEGRDCGAWRGNVGLGTEFGHGEPAVSNLPRAVPRHRSTAGEGRYADDVRVSAEHQRVEHDGGSELPGQEMSPARQRRAPLRQSGEGQDGGMRREGLPALRADEPPTLGVDRHRAGEADDDEGAEQHRRSHVPVADEVDDGPDPTPTRNGWRVMRTIPFGGSSRLASCATAVGFGVVMPITASRKAGTMRTMATGFHHSSGPQVSR